VDQALAWLFGAAEQGGHVSPRDVAAEVVRVGDVRLPAPVRGVRRFDPGT
jgi:hypothetical protein